MASVSPPSSYYDVLVKNDNPQSSMKRWLAEKYATPGRQRRSIEFDLTSPHKRMRRSVSVSGNKVNVAAGDQPLSSCVDPSDPKLPCNGPLNPNREYR